MTKRHEFTYLFKKAGSWIKKTKAFQVVGDYEQAKRTAAVQAERFRRSFEQELSRDEMIQLCFMKAPQLYRKPQVTMELVSEK